MECVELPRRGAGVEIEISPELLQDKCGVVGVMRPPGSSVAEDMYAGLKGVQHRGYDAAGAAVFDPEAHQFVLQRGLGTVDEVFADGHDNLLRVAPRASVGVGHTRYGTTGELSEFEAELAAQPHVGERRKVATAHNGNVENAYDVAEGLGVDRTECPSDSIAIGKSIEQLVDRGWRTVDAVKYVAAQLKGAFTLIVSDGKQLMSLCDPHGIRPLSIGRLPDGGIVFASETVALDMMGAAHIQDVAHGEMAVVSQDSLEDGVMLDKYACPQEQAFCGMEPPYLMAEASRLGGPNGRTVENLRQLMGIRLAQEHPVAPSENLIVVGVPASGITAAEAYAAALGLVYSPAIEKVKDERSFMGVDNAERQAITAGKLRIYAEMIAGKDLLVVDDTVVRGNASKVLTTWLRKLGARSVHLRIPFPKIVKGCHLGVNTADESELLATGRTHDQMLKFTGADSLEFTSVEGYRAALEPLIGKMCLGCVGERYPVDRHDGGIAAGRRLLGMMAVNPSSLVTA
jgi:amidophosphoribosyltransferase